MRELAGPATEGGPLDAVRLVCDVKREKREVATDNRARYEFDRPVEAIAAGEVGRRGFVEAVKRGVRTRRSWLRWSDSLGERRINSSGLEVVYERINEHVARFDVRRTRGREALQARE